MSSFVQNMIALGLTAICVAAVVWQIVRTFRGKAGAGGCCTKGCGAQTQRQSDPKSMSRTVFLSSDALRNSGKK
jgi:hypothetical protein